MPKDDGLEPPHPEPGDRVHLAARAGFSAIPLVGGSANEVFQALVMPPLERRLDAWRAAVVDTLRELRDKAGVDVESLCGDDRFLDAVLHATQTAVTTGQDAKRAALRAIVRNSALSPSLDEDLVHIFITLVERLTPTHLRLLRFADDPEGWFTENPAARAFSGGGLSSYIQLALPELKNRREFLALLWKDLHDRGLVDDNLLYVTSSQSQALRSRTTGHGRQFLEYVSE